MTRIVTAHAAESFNGHLEEVASGEGAHVIRVASEDLGAKAAADRILAERPDMVAIGVDSGVEGALAILEAIDLARPGLWSVLVAEPGAEMWQVALRSGARDLIDPGADESEIREALKRALDRLSARPAPAHAAPLSETDTTTGRVVTIVSPKGGCGKTMMATNLAYGLHSAGRGQVVIVDFDLQFGDVAGALGLRPEYSVTNAIQAAGDPTATRSFLTPHPSGMFALCAPTNPAEADAIDPARLKKLLETLQAEFDWVIVDTSAGVSEANLTAIEASTDVVVVATTDLAAIHAMRKAVVVLDQIGLTGHNRWYMLNRANARVGLDQADIERSVGLVIDGTVPSARAVPIAMNQGVPVLEDDPRSPAARSMKDFLAKLAPRDARGEDGKGWLQRIRS